jgi:hypothetical protein
MLFHGSGSGSRVTIQNTMARKMTKNRTVNMSDINEEVTPESKPDEQLRAECQHWVMCDLFGMMVPMSKWKDHWPNGTKSYWWAFCPKCGQRLQPDSPNSPDSKPAKAPLGSSEGQDSGQGVPTPTIEESRDTLFEKGCAALDRAKERISNQKP